MGKRQQQARTRTRKHGRRPGRVKGERLEADGLTHRRDCECARCEAGFVPTESDRETAARRSAARRGRLAAARAFERKKELARLKQVALAAYLADANATADAEVRRLRELRARALADRRLDELLRLRAEGVPLAEALLEVERRLPTPAGTEADNDNAVPVPPEAPYASCRVPALAPAPGASAAGTREAGGGLSATDASAREAGRAPVAVARVATAGETPAPPSAGAAAVLGEEPLFLWARHEPSGRSTG